MTASQRIDPHNVTPKGTSFEGVFRPGELENLSEELASPNGELRYRVSASLDNARRCVVSCIIEGFVFLVCQTTFEAFRHEISIDDRLVLVGSEEDLPPIEAEGDGEDFVVAGSPIEVRALVEEAVILALPMVPRKPGAVTDGKQGRVEAGKPMPFEALARLKRPDAK
ncbi:MAG TPA: YceD family protein [Usitatibacteraceae bacterium]|nr:YceD family protein [Usitatibacteraceae bacterium]